MEGVVPANKDPRQNTVARIVRFAAILGDQRSPDSFKFTISGMPNASSPSGTVVESDSRGLVESSPLFAVLF